MICIIYWKIFHVKLCAWYGGEGEMKENQSVGLERAHETWRNIPDPSWFGHTVWPLWAPNDLFVKWAGVISWPQRLLPVLWFVTQSFVSEMAQNKCQMSSLPSRIVKQTFKHVKQWGMGKWKIAYCGLRAACRQEPTWTSTYLPVLRTKTHVIMSFINDCTN